MRIVFMILVSCVLPAALLLGAARGEHTWAVVAPPEVDARILRQLEALAAQDQALIRFFPSLGQAERYRLQPGNLVIELHEEPNINSFVNALKSEGGALPMDSSARIGAPRLYPGSLLPSGFGAESAAHYGSRRSGVSSRLAADSRFAGDLALQFALQSGASPSGDSRGKRGRRGGHFRLSLVCLCAALSRDFTVFPGPTRTGSTSCVSKASTA